MVVEHRTGPESVLACLSQAPEPVPAAELKSALCRAGVCNKKEAGPLLKQAAASGAVFAWPKSRFWNRSPIEVARQAVLDALSGPALPKTALTAEAKRRSFDCGKIPAAITALLRERILAKAKPVGKTELFFPAARPGALLEPAAAALMAELRKLGVPGDPIQLLVGPPPAEPVSPAPVTPSSPDSTLPDRILDAVRRLQPGPGVPVTVYSLRAAVAGAPKAAFDRAVIQIADRQLIYLTAHDHGWALPETEREKLVFDGGQRLYVAVSLRD